MDIIFKCPALPPNRFDWTSVFNLPFYQDRLEFYKLFQEKSEIEHINGLLAVFGIQDNSALMIKTIIILKVQSVVLENWNPSRGKEYLESILNEPNSYPIDIDGFLIIIISRVSGLFFRQAEALFRKQARSLEFNYLAFFDDVWRCSAIRWGIFAFYWQFWSRNHYALFSFVCII